MFLSCDFLSRQGQIGICRYTPVHDTSVCTDLMIRPENENHRMIRQENQKALNNSDSFTDVACRWWEMWTSVYPGYVMSLGYTWPRRSRNLTSAHSWGWCVDASSGTSQVTLGFFPAAHFLKIQTPKRLKRTLFIRTKTPSAKFNNNSILLNLLCVWLIMFFLKIQTPERFKRTLFIRTKTQSAKFNNNSILLNILCVWLIMVLCSDLVLTC